MIVSANSRPAVVLRARGDGRTIERVDLRTRLGNEAQMHGARDAAFTDPEERFAAGAHAGVVAGSTALRFGYLHHDADSQRGQCCEIEGFRGGVIANADAEVVD